MRPEGNQRQVYSGRERVRIKYFSATGMAGGGLVGSDAWCKMARMKMMLVILIERYTGKFRYLVQDGEDENGVCDIDSTLVS